MVTPNCWRCLLRPSMAAIKAAPRRVAMPGILATMPGPMTTAAAFSVSAPVAASAPTPAAPKKRKGNASRKKKTYKPTGKSPLPGERKAFRKRIQLSNNNALRVEGLQTLTRQVIGDRKSIGSVCALSEPVVDQLRAVEAFKHTQTWGLFHAPHTLIRTETVELAERIQKAAVNKENLRMVISGDKVTGKSTLLLQAMTTAFLNDWIVINFPEAQELTTACTEYAPLPGTTPQQYMQPVYAYNILQQMRKASGHILQTMTVLNKHQDLSLEIITHASSLLDLIDSCKETETAWPVLQALWTELQTPSKDRRPVMVTLDGLAHIMRTSDYRSPAFELIHSHDLTLVRWFVDGLSNGNGFNGFPAGGAFIAAETKGNSPKSFSVELAIAQREAVQRGEEPPARDPYCRHYDARVDEALKDVPVLRLGGMSRAETRSLMEYWAASGLLRDAVDEKKVTDVWSIGGNGNVGEMERAALMTMKM
ncbi:hypothetical protein MCOR27_006530 [Pyricularia oryzae]|uniref:Small ribosomal subunit protein mS29 n=5 Tax=Pyricularia TaxID=48558 RepID=A0ABQ8NDH0_PYRGI|nr:uncharacterized protein MGG_09301 [Pyricularia oryzae 70-15]ELQ40609.1 hypothetical protein OOU_Y34scaffold00414g40 [Pyricularia oryzae Y34]KAH8841927.1 hypothetical protein MCOR01_005874 [Pyricularia oryzae]KAI6295292.1 hypothetical protein MCOR33_007798 [Pyricularia grisea]EHA57338.1 hypothetical protein MGG_09301 [Pyricularia oryzae 70-15]KAH9435103.1 hypothetical protein MCOR02_004060 [Pyricularia oryzae]